MRNFTLVGFESYFWWRIRVSKCRSLICSRFNSQTEKNSKLERECMLFSEVLKFLKLVQLDHRWMRIKSLFLPMLPRACCISWASMVPLRSRSMVTKFCFQPFRAPASSLNSVKPMEPDMSRWHNLRLKNECLFFFLGRHIHYEQPYYWQSYIFVMNQSDIRSFKGDIVLAIVCHCLFDTLYNWKEWTDIHSLSRSLYVAL